MVSQPGFRCSGPDVLLRQGPELSDDTVEEVARPFGDGE